MVLNSALCILKSEVSALVAINDVWNFEGDEECFGEALYCGFTLYRDMHDIDLYFGCLWGMKFLEFFTAKEITLDEELLLPDVVPDDHAIGIGPRCCKNVQRAQIVGQGIL